MEVNGIQLTRKEKNSFSLGRSKERLYMTKLSRVTEDAAFGSFFLQDKNKQALTFH